MEIRYRKPMIKERKTREYTHESNKEVFSEELRCLAIIYFNMEVSLVKIVREFSKVSL